MNQELFMRGISEIIDAKSFEARLKSGKKLLIKYGVDPTRPDIHLGHAVTMRKLRQLQDEGHKILFLIGDYTAKIGDPSGRNSSRPVLTDAEIKENAQTYFEQAGKILDVYKAQIWYNSEWFSGMRFNDILQMAAKFSVANIIERDDFANRLKEGNNIGLHEILYPVMQAYDSVELKADVEFGGSDQKFNMLAGRELQKKMGQIPQDVVIIDLLVGLDGKIKMSKSADNYISITEPANSMFGKIMSIPDEMMLKYFELTTDLSDAEIKTIADELESGTNPRDIKMRLASEIVTLYHDKASAEKATEEFVNRFSKGELPADITEIKIEAESLNISDLILTLDSTLSRSEIRRLVEQGAVKINDEKILDLQKEIDMKSGDIVRVGKLKIFKIK